MGYIDLSQVDEQPQGYGGQFIALDQLEQPEAQQLDPNQMSAGAIVSTYGLRGIKEIPQAIIGLPGALWQSAKKMVGSDGVMEGAQEWARQGFGVAGAGSGASVGAGIGAFGGPLAPVTVPLGAAIGGGLGYIGGTFFGDKAVQGVGGAPQTTAKEDLATLSYGLPQGAALGPIMKVGGEALGAVGRTAADAARPLTLLTKSGPEARAAAILDAAATKAGVTEIPQIDPLLRTPEATLGRLQTTAEAVNSPGLAALEKSVTKAAEMTDAYAQRSTARNQLRTEMIDAALAQVDKVLGTGRQALDAQMQRLPGEIAPELVGQALREGLTAKREAALDPARAAFEAAKRIDAELPFFKNKMALWDQKVKLEGPGAAKISGPVYSLFQDFVNGKGLEKTNKATPEFLQNIRSRAQALSKDPSVTGTDKIMAQEIRAQADAALSSGSFTGSQGGLANDLLDIGRRGWAKASETYKQGAVGKVLKERGYEYATNASNIGKVLRSSPEALEQFYKAAGDSPAMLDVMRQDIATQVKNIAKGASGNMTPESWARAVNKVGANGTYDYFPGLARQLRSVGGNMQKLANVEKVHSILEKAKKTDNAGNLTYSKISRAVGENIALIEQTLGKTHARALKAVVDDMTRQTEVAAKATLPSKGQSPTVQFGQEALSLKKQIVGSTVGRAIRLGVGAVAGGMGFGMLGAVLGPAALELAAAVGKHGESAVLAHLYDALMDPAKAKSLSAIANQRTMTTGIKDLLSGMIKAPQLISGAGVDGQRRIEQRSPVRAIPAPAAGRFIPIEAAGGPQTDKVWQAMLKVESGGNPRAVSPKGALGVAQLMPGTAQEMARKLGITGPVDLFDPVVNERLGRAYYEEQLQRFGDPILAAQAYNMGPTGLAQALAGRRAMPAETQKYAQLVRALSGGS